MGERTIYDYVIVDAGSAGCVLANRLTEDPDTTVLGREFALIYWFSVSSDGSRRPSSAARAAGWVGLARISRLGERSEMPIDTALIGALHVEYLERQGLREGEHRHHTLFQTSTIEALLDGNYEGDVSFAELGDRGDFGLGTFDALDGELIALDGDFFQVRADGRAYAVDEQSKTPFAVVTFFEPDLLRSITNIGDITTLCAYLDRVVEDRAVCYAVRVDGYFDYVKTRSVPRQHKPFPPLVEVVKHQPTFELHSLRGSLAGFRFPDRVGGLNVAGYHFHFISEDRRVGGHLLECRIAHGELRIDHEVDLQLELPAGVAVAAPSMTAEKKDALNRAERG